MTMCVAWKVVNKILEEYATSMFKVEVGSNRFCCSASSQTWEYHCVQTEQHEFQIFTVNCLHTLVQLISKSKNIFLSESFFITLTVGIIYVNHNTNL